MEEHMKSLMTLVDDIKDSIPEGKYIEMCNMMKDLFNKTPKKEVREWKEYKLTPGEQMDITFDSKKNMQAKDIKINTIYYKPSYHDGTYYPCEYEISFTRLNDNTLHRMSMKQFRMYLHRHMNLSETSLVRYTSPIGSDTTATNYSTYEWTIQAVVKQAVDDYKLALKLQKEHKIDDEDEDELEHIMEIVYTPNKTFNHYVIQNICNDIEKYYDMKTV